MIAVLVGLGLIGYCGGYASALCLADAALLAWMITL